MNKTKAKIDFSGYPGAEVGPLAQNILEQMTANGAQFPGIPFPLGSTLGPAIGNFNTKLAAKESKATADIIAFDVARHDLEGILFELGNFVNSVAKGDPVIVVASGFPSYETGKPADYSAPAAPTDLRLRQGDLSGQVVARYHSSRPRSLNEVQTNLADPNNEAAWHYVGMFSGGKAVLAGFTPGATLWVRVRTAGLNAVMGAWSDPAKIFVN